MQLGVAYRLRFNITYALVFNELIDSIMCGDSVAIISQVHLRLHNSVNATTPYVLCIWCGAKVSTKFICLIFFFFHFRVQLWHLACVQFEIVNSLFTVEAHLIKSASDMVMSNKLFLISPVESLP